MLASIPLEDNDIIILLIEPLAQSDKKPVYQSEKISNLVIKEVISSRAMQDKNSLANLGLKLNSSPNVACFFSEWKYESAALAKMYINGFSCTGTLLNNDSNNRTPYFLTARHCLTNYNFEQRPITEEEKSHLNTATFNFYYRSFDCGGNTIEQEYVFSQGGATYLDFYFWTDHLLIRLNTNDLPPYVNYAGWDRSIYPNFSPFNATCIHHPAGEIQKITLGTAQTPGPDGYKFRFDWSVGYTEGGSSGAPLFNQYHKIIGQLSFGFTFDTFGKLSESWSHSGGGVQPYLSPSNQTSINPLIPMVIYGPTQLCYGSQGTFNMPNLKSSESVTWSVSGNLQIVSSTNNSVVVTPISPSSSGKGTVTGSYSAPGIPTKSSSMEFSVGVPDPNDVFVTNNTTGYSNVNPLPFCYYQSNNLDVTAINPALGSNEAIDAQWTFPTDWSPNTTTGAYVQTTPYNMNGNNSFSVKTKNSCGWQIYPKVYGLYYLQCGGYYRYQVYPNPAKEIINVSCVEL